MWPKVYRIWSHYDRAIADVQVVFRLSKCCSIPVFWGLSRDENVAKLFLQWWIKGGRGIPDFGLEFFICSYSKILWFTVLSHISEISIRRKVTEAFIIDHNSARVLFTVQSWSLSESSPGTFNKYRTRWWMHVAGDWQLPALCMLWVVYEDFHTWPGLTCWVIEMPLCQLGALVVEAVTV